MDSRWSTLAAAAALLLGTTACDIDSLLEVDDPDIVTPETLTGPQGLATLRAGALGDFAFAYAGNAGGTEGQILVAGLFTDEFIHSGTFTTRAEVDLRDVEEDNGTMTGVFSNLQRARQALETAATAIREGVSDPSSDARIAEMLGLAGFTYVMAGENYCSGVPFSDLVEGQIVPGEPLTTDQVMERAIERFDRALANTAGSESMANMARIGKARALVNLGRYDEAAQVVADVPTDFEFLIQYSTNTARQENGVYNFNVVFERWSLADSEAGEGLAFRTADDARVPWERNPPGDLGFDESTPQFNLLKYPGRAAAIPIATGEEARLIEAEAALEAGNVSAFLANVNEVRDRHGLGDVSDPGTESGRVDLLFRERAFSLFATSHRLGDLRRLVRQYERSPEAVFPSGAYFKGGTYGSDVNLPVPFSERNNPLFTGCLNRGA